MYYLEKSQPHFSNSEIMYWRKKQIEKELQVRQNPNNADIFLLFGAKIYLGFFGMKVPEKMEVSD